MNFESWGRFPPAGDQHIVSPLTHRDAARALQRQPTPILPRGLGRSYGDSCLNTNGSLISTACLDKFISFNASTGTVRCEAGVTFEDLILTFLPRGWFPPVTAGTKFITIGGAIANDIHGKNHHLAGNFSHHVKAFHLLRSDSTKLLCSRTENPDYFRATIGGLGLTGLILWADVQLKPVQGSYINMESIKFKSVDEFLALTAESNEYEYSVSWLDCLATGKKFGRGVFMRGTHSEVKAKNSDKSFHTNAAWKTMPFEMPDFLLSKPSIAAFNFFYYHRQLRRRAASLPHYDTFFYPLDSILEWNKIYGRRGFLQWQCVVPAGEQGKVMKEILMRITASGFASFLAVLKMFGSILAEGLLSFPTEGLTLALDFPNEGVGLHKLLNELDHIVVQNGGRIYPAKDARMSGETFRRSFPQVELFEKFIDPKFSSSFYRRVMQDGRECIPDAALQDFQTVV